MGLSVMPDKLPAALAIMADVARNPTFAPEELERARKEALDGLDVAYGDPGEVAAFATAPVTYAGTSFAHAAGGTPNSLKRLTRDDLVGFHDGYWRPDNAILVLTGDITPEPGFALAEQAFGDWPKPAGPPPARAGGHARPHAPQHRHRPAGRRPGGGDGDQAGHGPHRSALLPGRWSPTPCSAAAIRRGSTRSPHQARALLRRGLLAGGPAHAGRLHRRRPRPATMRPPKSPT